MDKTKGLAADEMDDGLAADEMDEKLAVNGMVEMAVDMMAVDVMAELRRSLAMVRPVELEQEWVGGRLVAPLAVYAECRLDQDMPG